VAGLARAARDGGVTRGWLLTGIVPLLSAGGLLFHLIGWGRPGTRRFRRLAVTCAALLVVGLVAVLLFVATLL
jgi:hypothetical protein